MNRSGKAPQVAEDNLGLGNFGLRRKAIILDNKLPSSNNPHHEEKAVAMHHVGDNVDLHKTFSSNIDMSTLSYPQQLKVRPLFASETSDHVETRLKGMPGTLTLDYSTSQKYFGDSARDRFFDRHRWLDQQRQITTPNSVTGFNKLFFEKEKITSAETMPFGAIRNTGIIKSLDNDDNELDSQGDNSFQSRFKSANESVNENDDMRLRENARRSGMETADEFDEFDEEMMLQELNNMKTETIEGGDTPSGFDLDEEGDEDDSAAAPPSRLLAHSQSSKGIGFMTTISNSKRKLGTSTPNNKLLPKSNLSRQSTVGGNALLRPLTASSDINTPNNYTPSNISTPRSNAASSSHHQRTSLLQEKKKAIVYPVRKRASTAKNSRKSSLNEFKPVAKVDTREDLYSGLILEELFRQRNIQALEAQAAATDANNEEAKKEAKHSADDDSVITASTISTIGLLLGQRTNNPQSLHLTLNEGGNEFDISRGPIASPRTRFLAGCMKEHINPRASLLLRRNLSKELNLQHHGMGNTMARLLADCLQSLPFIQAINVADNMLNDDGLGPIILSAVHIPGLLELNLSQNEIGPVSAKALFDYLISPLCPLERLILKSADVDDFECERFIEAIKQNKSLRELNLSANKIGTAENLNTVMPDIITGGEAIASLLRSSACQLTILKLEWNMIRLDGAIDLADSLSINETLTYLDLSFNSLSTQGGVTLGVSLLHNKALQTLILASNSLDSVATFTICAGIIENYSLKKVVFDGNPIGSQGMKALMLVPALAGNRVKVTAARCNVNIIDTRCWFNFDKLLRDYDLNMENGFERAIALILLHLIAGHHSYVFSKFVHESVTKNNNKNKSTGNKNTSRPATSSSSKTAKKETPKAAANTTNKNAAHPTGKLKHIELIQIPSNGRSLYFDDRQKEVLAGLHRVKAAASDIQSAVRFFQEVDLDGSGELDLTELGKLMKLMGLKLTDKRLSELFNQFDVDQGGKLELHEFLMLLKQQNKEASSRIKELVQSPVMTLKGDKGHRYLPPDNGLLHITVVDGFAKKKLYRIMSSCDREYIDEVAEGVGGTGAAAMLSSSLQGTKLRLDEGLTVAETMLMDSADKVGMVKNLILRMNDFDDARHLISSVLEDDRADMMRLKREMGPALKVILGNPNGYYILDLSKEIDRLCLEKLLEISMTNAVFRSESSPLGFGRVGDISQKGNFSCFRNEMFNGEAVTISAAFASPMPFSGILDFDFSCTPRPPREALVLSDQRVIKVLMHHFLLEPRDAAVALHKLAEAKRNADKTLPCNGVSCYEMPMDHARLVGENVELFHENISLRRKNFQSTQDKEASSTTDDHGRVVTLFERDASFPMPLTISDYFIRQENKARELAEKQAAERELQLEKERRHAERWAIYGARPSSPNKSNHHHEDGSHSTENSDDDSSGSSHPSHHLPADGDDMDNHNEEGSQSTTAAPDSLKALKAAMASFDDDDDDNGNANNGLQGSIESQESLNWQQEFELLKLATLKPNEVPPSPVANDRPRRRKNIASEPNHAITLIEGDEFMGKFKQLLLSPQVHVGAKAHRIVDMLDDMFARSWICSRHLALITECFAWYGYYKQTNYCGTYRVDLIVALFSRIVDLHNFELVIEVLSPYEVACVYCRLGWLNVYNPCKPEGSWELDLSRREERTVAKTLCCLATHEPGDNWLLGTFRWMRDMDPMPGWQLTQPWLTEEGMPMRGLLNVTYYSGEGKGKKGCKAYVAFRKALLRLVLINEEEIVSDDMRTRPPPLTQAGDRALQRHIQLWETYLAPESVDPNRKR